MTIIEINDLWKKYPLYREKIGLKEFFLKLPKFIKKNRYKDSFLWALKEINLRVYKGECLGIIGKNGSGKSTLLSIILGTIYPTKGNIKVNARITPLLELSAGFHPDLTGKENILLNGVLLGLLKKEVMERINEIISFSEIGNFIDMPIRTYSTGMFLRLAFSIAIHTNPELLLIDEILSVGDEYFQKKSNEAITNLIKGGTTTILVSHNLNAIKEICNRVIWLDKGEIKGEGKPNEIIEMYLNKYNNS